MFSKYVRGGRLKRAAYKFEDEEDSKARANERKAEKVIKMIIKKDDPIEELKKKEKKEARKKPINTRMLLHGFI